VPFRAGLLCAQAQAEGFELALDGGEFGCEDAGEDQVASWVELLGDSVAVREEEIGAEIGADDIEPGFGLWGQSADVLLADLDTVFNPIAAGIAERNADSHGIGIHRVDGVITQFGCGDREDAGAATEIQDGAEGGRMPGAKAGDLPKAEGGGGMMAGAEA
jgi:hypothetical protein